jgi:hypothetical protein
LCLFLRDRWRMRHVTRTDCGHRLRS